MSIAEWNRAAWLGSGTQRKWGGPKETGEGVKLVTRKNSARNPELEIMLGRCKAQLSDLASLGIRHKAAWGVRVERKCRVERPFLILEWELGPVGKEPKGIQLGNPPST